MSIDLTAGGHVGSRRHRPPGLRAQSEAEATADLTTRIASAPRDDLRLHRFRLALPDKLGEHRGQLDPETASRDTMNTHGDGT